MNFRMFEMIKLRRALPGATDEMVDAFVSLHGCRLVTARIWAEQGTLRIEGGQIIKCEPPQLDRSAVVQELERLLRL